MTAAHLIEFADDTSPKNADIDSHPKPPSLAEQALNDLDVLLDIAKREGVFSPPGTIRLALERLQQLELENHG